MMLDLVRSEIEANLFAKAFGRVQRVRRDSDGYRDFAPVGIRQHPRSRPEHHEIPAGDDLELEFHHRGESFGYGNRDDLKTAR